MSLERFLSRRGYEVFTAASGPEGYAIVERETIDLTITDFRMPGWSGLEALRRIKTRITSYNVCYTKLLRDDFVTAVTALADGRWITASYDSSIRVHGHRSVQ